MRMPLKDCSEAQRHGNSRMQKNQGRPVSGLNRLLLFPIIADFGLKNAATRYNLVGFQRARYND